MMDDTVMLAVVGMMLQGKRVYVFTPDFEAAKKLFRQIADLGGGLPVKTRMSQGVCRIEGSDPRQIGGSVTFAAFTNHDVCRGAVADAVHVVDPNGELTDDLYTSVLVMITSGGRLTFYPPRNGIRTVDSYDLKPGEGPKWRSTQNS